MRRRHLQFILAGSVADQIESLRRRYDSVMAARTPAHISLVYPEEYDDETLLISRAASAARHTSLFTVTLGEASGENGGRGGVWYSIADPSRTWNTLRAAILSTPLRTLPIEPHVTVVHPRTSGRGPEALADLSGVGISGKVDLSEIVYTETDASGMRVLDRFQLLGSSANRMVGAVLRKSGKVLLCLRSSDRAQYPGVWDVPGGHLDELESPERGLARELEEELGIKPHIPGGGPWETQRIDDFEFSVFVIDHWAGEIQNLAVHEHDDVRWVALEELAHLGLAHASLADLLTRAMNA